MTRTPHFQERAAIKALQMCAHQLAHIALGEQDDLIPTDDTASGVPWWLST